MKNTKTILGVVAVIVLVAGAAIILTKKTQAPIVPVPAVSSGESATATYTMSDVAQHASKSSCWTAISGGVYDVTTWIGQHPGGERAILSLCGTDGTSAFDGQHGGDPRALSVLPNFKIGTLAN